MSKKKLVIILVIVLVAAGGFIFVQSRPKASAVTYRTSTVTKGTLVATVSGSGNVVVNDSAKVTPSITGTVANLNVQLGDTVKKGQRLFTIVNDQLDITVQKANTSYLQAKQLLVNAQAAYDAAKLTYADQVGSVGKAKALAALEQAKLALVQSQDQLTTDQAALANNTTSAELQQKVVVDQAIITTNQHAVNSAQSAYDKLVAGKGTAVSTAKAQLAAAKTAVETAKQNVTSELADLNDQKETAAERTVTAPIAGTITTLSIANGDTLGGSSSGAGATATTPIIIQDMSSLKAVVSINEVDIADVAVGQKASMSFDAVSTLTLTGKVEKVDASGTATQGVVSYSATIGFDALDAKVRPEMSVNGIITTEVKQDVLSITSTAIKTQSDDSNYVQVMENGLPRNQTVTIGIASDTDTEIVTGLTEGQTVVTQTITSTSTTNTSTTGGGGPGGGGGFPGGGFLRGGIGG